MDKRKLALIIGISAIVILAVIICVFVLNRKTKIEQVPLDANTSNNNAAVEADAKNINESASEVSPTDLHEHAEDNERDNESNNEATTELDYNSEFLATKESITKELDFLSEKDVLEYDNKAIDGKKVKSLMDTFASKNTIVIIVNKEIEESTANGNIVEVQSTEDAETYIKGLNFGNKVESDCKVMYYKDFGFMASIAYTENTKKLSNDEINTISSIVADEDEYTAYIVRGPHTSVSGMVFIQK